MSIRQLMDLALQHEASDLHLSAGMPPLLRVHGEMQPLARPALDEPELTALLTELLTELPSDGQRRALAAARELDFAVELRPGSRWRVNLYRQRRGAGAALRAVPATVRRLESLGAPSVLQDLALRPSGLVLLTGPTGSGKSTTMAALVDHCNRHRSGHIVTIEDPIEFVHESLGCLITQREVGAHSAGFSQALRAALRQDPDVILVGELRDLETIRLALTAAETGHLVLATLHSSSAPQAVDRLVDVFPAEEKAFVRTMLAESLQGVVAQALCRTADGRGRVAALEIMLGTPAIRHLIREGKVAQMVSVMQSGLSQGMQTLDQHLAQLVREGRVGAAQARLHARHPEHMQ